MLDVLHATEQQWRAKFHAEYVPNKAQPQLMSWLKLD